jgi:hypothetical protein
MQLMNIKLNMKISATNVQNIIIENGMAHVQLKAIKWDHSIVNVTKVYLLFEWHHLQFDNEFPTY